MYKTSDNYKAMIYDASTKHELRIYINNIEIETKYILNYKGSQMLFSNNKFELGSVTSQAIELKLYKSAIPKEIHEIYIESGIEGETIPIGYFNVEDMVEEDDYVVTLKLLDNMIKFEFNYDGSEVIENKGYAELGQVLKDICLKAGVDIRFYFFFKYEQKSISI